MIKSWFFSKGFCWFFGWVKKVYARCCYFHLQSRTTESEITKKAPHALIWCLDMIILSNWFISFRKKRNGRIADNNMTHIIAYPSRKVFWEKIKILSTVLAEIFCKHYVFLEKKPLKSISISTLVNLNPWFIIRKTSGLVGEFVYRYHLVFSYRNNVK